MVIDDMRTIQEVGTEILTNSPSSFYVMTGNEYGIKSKYIDILTKFYGRSVTYPNVASVLKLMRVEHLIPLEPCVYIVRHDDEFVSKLAAGVQESIKDTKIVGTIVCIYDGDKYTVKLDKYLPNYTVSIDNIDQRFMKKYLLQDFPGIADNVVDRVIQIASDYNQARNMCMALISIDPAEIVTMPFDRFSKLFGKEHESTELQIRQGIAARDFNFLLRIIETVDDKESILYTIMSTMCELDKLLDSSYVNSDIKAYVKNWNRPDVYYMFCNTYEELKRSRSSMAYDIDSCLTYLFSLLQFSPIPAPEVLL